MTQNSQKICPQNAFKMLIAQGSLYSVSYYSCIHSFATNEREEENCCKLRSFIWTCVG